MTVRNSGPRCTRPSGSRKSGESGAVLAITSALPSPSRSATTNGEYQIPISMFQPRSRRQRNLPEEVYASSLCGSVAGFHTRSHGSVPPLGVFTT